MKFHDVFQTYLQCSDEAQVFQYLKNTLTDSITLWNYFVSWQKVLQNFKKVEMHLNTLNYLVGKDNVEDEFCLLLQNYPDIIDAIPILIACRTSSFKILTDYSSGNFQYDLFDFKKKSQLTMNEIHQALEFVKKTGVLELFKNKTIKSIPDYVLGIEVGLDSNGRKNRGGNTMEAIVQKIITSICQENNLSFMEQATSEKIQKEWNITLKVDKSNRRFDFATKNQNTLYLIETNFYGGPGSKLKATAGEYKSLFDFVSLQEHKFIWITDGLGWKTILRPLEETFNHIDYTLNLNMIATGLLSAIIVEKL